MNKTLLAQVSDWDAHLDPNTGVPYLSAFEVVFQNVLAIAAGAAGLTCFVMLIIGGFQYLTAGGDQKALAKAKMTLTWAVIGIIVLVGSWFLIRFINEFTGAAILDFTIPKGVPGPAPGGNVPAIPPAACLAPGTPCGVGGNCSQCCSSASHVAAGFGSVCD
ncbi:pilin [Patescibacteria group bacterium]|nr:pilin [Patescibacteria group bacterium]MBU1931499.1 pilin [Patescibacteria group bacterium]